MRVRSRVPGPSVRSAAAAVSVFMVEAGGAGWSAPRESSTAPVAASTTSACTPAPGPRAGAANDVARAAVTAAEVGGRPAPVAPGSASASGGGGGDGTGGGAGAVAAVVGAEEGAEAGGEVRAAEVHPARTAAATLARLSATSGRVALTGLGH